MSDIKLKDMTDDQLVLLKDQIDKELEKSEKNVWDLEEGNEYWFTNSVLGVHKDKRKHRAIDK